MKKYKCKRTYKIWMYTVSHSTLILRSEKQYPDVAYKVEYDNPNITIDITFNATDFISIPEKIEGIEIINNGDKYIINNNKNWYIKAANCFIGKYEGENEEEIWTGNLKYDELIRI